MTDLIRKVNELPDVYDDFLLGVINYAKKNPEHVKLLNEYFDSHSGLSTADVVEFIMSQPNFHTYSAVEHCEKVC